MYADGQYNDEYRITNEGVLIQNQTQAIISSIIAGIFGSKIIYLWRDTRQLSDGWTTAVLCQNHPWVLYFWVEIPFFMFCLNCCCMRQHEKACEYNNDFRYKCGVIILLTTTTTTTTTITAVCVVVVDNSICLSDVTIGTGQVTKITIGVYVWQ